MTNVIMEDDGEKAGMAVILESELQFVKPTGWNLNDRTTGRTRKSPSNLFSHSLSFRGVFSSNVGFLKSRSDYFWQVSQTSKERLSAVKKSNLVK